MRKDRGETPRLAALARGDRATRAAVGAGQVAVAAVRGRCRFPASVFFAFMARLPSLKPGGRAWAAVPWPFIRYSALWNLHSAIAGVVLCVLCALCGERRPSLAVAVHPVFCTLQSAFCNRRRRPLRQPSVAVHTVFCTLESVFCNRRCRPLRLKAPSHAPGRHRCPVPSPRSPAPELL